MEEPVMMQDLNERTSLNRVSGKAFEMSELVIRKIE